MVARDDDAIRIRRRMARRMARQGCIPATLLGTLLLLFACNAITFWNAPTWVNNRGDYLLTGRYTLSLSVLGVLQLLATWLLGLLAARAGTAAARSQGTLLRLRLSVARQRMMVYAWAVVILRLLILLALGVGAVLAYTTWLGLRLNWEVAVDVRQSWRAGWLIVLVALVAGTLHWVVGPFLRVRYSTALGALASTWVADRAQRTWAALTARLGAGLVGAVAILWGGAAGSLVVTQFLDRMERNGVPLPELFPHWPDYVGRLLAVMLCGIAALVLYGLGQVVLPEVYTRTVQRRLRGGAAQPPERATFQSRTKKTAVL